jgi:hypothetical protein
MQARIARLVLLARTVLLLPWRRAGLPLVFVAALLPAPAQAFPAPPKCSQQAFDQRLTGLEPGLWISDALTVGGVVFFAADSARSRSWGGFLSMVFLNLASLSGLATMTGGAGECAVRPNEELPDDRWARPFSDREEAREHRAGKISTQKFVLGFNLVISGLMLPLVHDRGSRIALSTAIAFPVVYSLLNLRKFSPERMEDAGLPPRTAIHLVPVLPDGTGRGEGGLMVGWNGAF